MWGFSFHHLHMQISLERSLYVSHQSRFAQLCGKLVSLCLIGCRRQSTLQCHAPGLVLFRMQFLEGEQIHRVEEGGKNVRKTKTIGWREVLARTLYLHPLLYRVVHHSMSPQTFLISNDKYTKLSFIVLEIIPFFKCAIKKV